MSHLQFVICYIVNKVKLTLVGQNIKTYIDEVLHTCTTGSQVI